MNQRPTLFKPVGPASLAGEEDFQLGGILVRPSLREVEANGAKESLESRVMQVLVALARANGAVLSLAPLPNHVRRQSKIGRHRIPNGQTIPTSACCDW